MGFSEEHTRIILLNRHSIHSIRLTPNDLLYPYISALSPQWENLFPVDSDEHRDPSLVREQSIRLQNAQP